jgi:hypothetical protein
MTFLNCLNSRAHNFRSFLSRGILAGAVIDALPRGSGAQQIRKAAVGHFWRSRPSLARNLPHYRFLPHRFSKGR